MPKFESEDDERVYGISLDLSNVDQEDGNSLTCWYSALVRLGHYDDLPGNYAILEEDTQGFIDVVYFWVWWEVSREWKEVMARHDSHGCRHV